MKLNLNRGIKGALFGGVVLLAGTGVIGCSNKEDVPSTPSLLEGTILEDTYVVIDSNEDVYIVRPTEEYHNIDISSSWDGKANHYVDVLSGNCYHEALFDNDSCYFEMHGIFSIDIVSQESISHYLTTEDLSKGEFSNEDVVEIIQRVRDGSSTDTNVNTEEKAKQYTK